MLYIPLEKMVQNEGLTILLFHHMNHYLGLGFVVVMDFLERSLLIVVFALFVVFGIVGLVFPFLLLLLYIVIKGTCVLSWFFKIVEELECLDDFSC